jgi:BRCA1/BRCA2-containing complex subunit 3
MEYADKLKIDLKRPDLRIVSWYHSHPRITVWPSVVDLRTQANYQVMDKDFVGLIFSVFDTSVETMVMMSVQIPDSANQIGF